MKINTVKLMVICLDSVGEYNNVYKLQILLNLVGYLISYSFVSYLAVLGDRQ